ncbi:interleukin-1 receptor-associated kinase 1-binding protein 1 homolog [Myripristis murdjan]|uniref:Interleukin-1 receptor-associated kinase 1 binding protein 1 n=1 Tax=Myripristis murdjan TaxID=586833 RepID=A0A667ZBT2_9TELE|nr:interleukin-1 receptor-associated kinase 1-binding protein 1 [Myripristis murdjan]
MDSPGRAFASLARRAAGDYSHNENQLEAEVPKHTPVHRPGHGSGVRELQVTGVAEVWCPADRVTVRISVGNSKESVHDVSNSVSRRLEYILQTLKQHGVKEEDASVRRFLHREDDLYHMDVEVTVTFSDFERMERVTGILLEKLDKSVCLGSPQFYHSAECLSQLRQQACVAAVENARQKASEISRLLGQSLGRPLLVREEETREWRKADEEDSASHSRLPCRPTATASSRVAVSFSLRDTTRKKL